MEKALATASRPMHRSLRLAGQALLALVAACDAASDADVEAAPATPPSPTAEQPRLELVETRRGADRASTVVLRLVNDTDRAWSYRAYAEDAPLTLRHVRSAGSWRPQRLLCGAGLMPFDLAPGEAVLYEQRACAPEEDVRLAAALESIGPRGELMACDAAVDLP